MNGYIAAFQNNILGSGDTKEEALEDAGKWWRGGKDDPRLEVLPATKYLLEQFYIWDGDVPFETIAIDGEEVACSLKEAGLEDEYELIEDDEEDED